ncbi:MAG TPA: TM2 domain-containing protein [Gemmatimonadales bacterium]|jgi:hypothetical protein|nr:TM2 domain-containing protein [Gemmatimonadales bacterium]
MADDEIFASPRSRMVALLLACILGFAGAHRFYAGKVKTGILQLLSLGGFGLWWLYDIILISGGSFRDSEGRVISSWEPEGDHLVTSGTAAAILDELDSLRAEVGTLHERLDFAERLLTDHSRPASGEQ